MNTLRDFISPVILLAALLGASTAGVTTTHGQQHELLNLLRSEAPAAEKAIACKKLAIHGSALAVPELSKLLPDPRLSSWARIALEAIPGEAADEALRQAAHTMKGRLLVGVINSIGVRRDTQAVHILVKKLEETDTEVASAAAVALGHIANPTATKTLRNGLTTTSEKIRSAVAEGCVLCAERLLSEGESMAATEIYDQVRQADVSMQRTIEATRGAILSRKQEGIPLLIQTFRSENKKLFQLALGTIREFPGAEIDKALAEEVASAPPRRAALLIQAMADRTETVVLKVVLQAAVEGDKQVRLSAIDSLRRIGDDSCLQSLLQIAIEGDSDLAQAAQETLALLPSSNVDGKIVALLSSAEGSAYPILLQLVGQRRINAVEDVLQALNRSDERVRHTALVALGEIVSLQQLSLLVSQAITPKHPTDATVAQRALKTASVRMPDREACAGQLVKALRLAPDASKTVLLEILSAVGGTKALQAVATAAKSEEPQLQDTGSRLLGKWNSVAAAPLLLDLAKTGPVEKYRVRALRGYIGLARRFAMPDQQRAEMLRSALEATDRTAEHRLVLDVLQLHPSAPGLKLAADATKIPALESNAKTAAMVIAKKVAKEGVDARELLSRVGLEIGNLEIKQTE